MTEQIVGAGSNWELVIGITLIFTVLFARRGLMGIFEDMTTYWRRRLYLVGVLGTVLSRRASGSSAPR